MYKEEWILNLKPGDKVILEDGGRRATKKVEKVLPSGIVVVSGLKFNPDGELRGGGVWNVTGISKWSQEEQTVMDCDKADKENIKYLEHLKFRDMSREQRKNLVAYIRELTGEKGD